MKNQVIQIQTKEFEGIKPNILNKDKLKVAILNGEKIHAIEDFASLMVEEFDLPMDNVRSLDAFLDWMCDLEWIHEQEIVVVIYNFDNCIEDSVKKEIIKMFGQIILPFLEKEVEEVVKVAGIT
ncbi:barstar family protein [Enterococcus sp. LJL51]|uniref:barstar family protein n=1 Tax=Enterococcus sp. LJL51 TaxID=3416656 RepID=UPI003CE8D2DC